MKILKLLTRILSIIQYCNIFNLHKFSFNIDEYVNWVEVGAVTPVKNQGNFGTCWAFPITGAIEGLNFIKSNKLISLSEEALVNNDYPDLGIYGGNYHKAIKLIVNNGGYLPSEKEWPYNINNPIKKNYKKIINYNNPIPSMKITGIKKINNNNYALKQAIKKQPVCIYINGYSKLFTSYKLGIYNLTIYNNVDHGVLLVGYDTAKDYWLIKNSWGEKWGENGYMRVSMKNNPYFEAFVPIANNKPL